MPTKIVVLRGSMVGVLPYVRGATRDYAANPADQVHAPNRPLMIKASR